MHQITRENLETYLADLEQGEDFSCRAPLHVEAAFRGYLKCGLLCHGFARAYCAACGLLGVFLRAMETTVRQRSPDAPAGSRFGAVAFVHRFGSYLNSHIHYHVLVTDGVFSAGEDDQAEFHPALDLDDEDFLAVQTKMRKRGLRWLHRHGHLDDLAVHTMDNADHAGGWSVNASVTIPDWDRHGLEQLVRYCARPPMSQQRLGRLNDETLVYSLRKPTVDGRTELVELLHNPAKAMTHTAGTA